jgi:hypothetical protein
LLLLAIAAATGPHVVRSRRCHTPPAHGRNDAERDDLSGYTPLNGGPAAANFVLVHLLLLCCR